MKELAVMNFELKIKNADLQAQYTTELAKWQRRVAEFENENNVLTQTMKQLQLQSALGKWQGRIALLEKESSVLREENERLGATMRDGVADMRQRIVELVNEGSIRATRCMMMEKHNGDLKAETQALRAEYEQFKQESKEENGVLKAKIAQLRGEFVELERFNQDLKGEIDYRLMEESELKEENKALGAEYDQREQASKEENDVLKAEIGQLRGELIELEQFNQGLEREIDRLLEENERIGKQHPCGISLVFDDEELRNLLGGEPGPDASDSG